MKGYLVDTNIPSELTRERPDARVAAFLDNAGQNGRAHWHDMGLRDRVQP